MNPVEDDEYIEFDSDEIEGPIQGLSEYEKAKSQGRMSFPTDTHMVLFEPRTFEEAEEVARFLKDKRAAVVNEGEISMNIDDLDE